jgi:hypothetical protein
LFETQDNNQAMALNLSSRNRKVKYNFGKIRVYLNAAVAVLAMIFSVSLLARLLDVLLLIYYFGLTTVVTILMFKIKVIILFRIQGTNPKKEQLFTVGQVEDKNRARKWEPILILLGAITFCFILPLILVLVLEPAYWFVSFTSLVTGVSLSEIVLYLSADRSKKLSC